MSRGLGKNQRFLLSLLREAPIVTIFKATETFLRSLPGDQYYLMNEAKKRTCQASLRRAARELERRGLCMILPVLDLVQITKISTKWEVDPFGWDNEAWSYRERLVTRRRFERYRHSKVAAIARPDYAFPAHLRSNS